jgi:DNA mismatch endonuclease (patch repair protein)
MDTVSRAKRSAIMSAVRGRGNRSTELQLASLLRVHRITGWRRKAPLLGKPDFVFRDKKVAIFVDGCFWHGCPRHQRMPKSHVAFWSKKLARNVERDAQVSRMLRARGWLVLRIWECALSKTRKPNTMARIARALGQSCRNPHAQYR